VHNRFPKLEEFRYLTLEAEKPHDGLLRPIVARTFRPPDHDPGPAVEVYARTQNFSPLTPAVLSLLHLHPVDLASRCSPVLLKTLRIEGADTELLAFMFRPSAPMSSSLVELCDLRLVLRRSRHHDRLDNIQAILLKSMLFVAKSLKTLHLSLPVNASRPPLPDVLFSQTTWLNLTDVELAGVSIDVHHLASFVERHSKTLKRLRLHRLALKDRLDSQDTEEDNLHRLLWKKGDAAHARSIVLGPVLESATIIADQDEGATTILWK
jgi:hypothetical protein